MVRNIGRLKCMLFINIISLESSDIPGEPIQAVPFVPESSICTSLRYKQKGRRYLCTSTILSNKMKTNALTAMEGQEGHNSITIGFQAKLGLGLNYVKCNVECNKLLNCVR